MGKLVEESPQESVITELQVPLVVQVPASADRLALSLNFRLTGVLQQRHLIVNSCATGSSTLQLAVQVNRHVGRVLLSQDSTSFRRQAIYLTTLRV